MKKAIVMTIMAIMAIAAYAADEPEFTVTSGSFIETTHQKGKTATIQFDYLNARVGDLKKMDFTDKTLEQYMKEEDPDGWKQWDNYMKRCKKFFTNRWNDEKKVIKIVDGDKADYHIIFKADEFDTGNGVASAFSFSKRDGGVVMSGTLSIQDASGNTVCTVKVVKYRGAATRNMDFKMPTFDRRLELFHKSLAKDLLEDIKK